MSTATSRTGQRIDLEGELDIARKDELMRLFGSIQKDGPLIIDLRQVTYADSTFLQLLASLALRFQEVPITLLGAPPNLRRLFDVVQFDKLFQIVDDEELVPVESRSSLTSTNSNLLSAASAGASTRAPL